jgi:hypothetical protein
MQWNAPLANKDIIHKKLSFCSVLHLQAQLTKKWVTITSSEVPVRYAERILPSAPKKGQKMSLNAFLGDSGSS